MSRLQTIRAYFIERFFAALQGDAELVGLTQPAELFDGDGKFAVSADEAGFARIPSPAAVRRRAAVAPEPERAQLERFGRVLARALGELAAAGPLDSARLTAMAERFCPYIHHPPGQRFLPVDMGDYLRVNDAGLRSTLYTVTGQRPVAADIVGALFENAEVWSAPAPPREPYTAKVPFVASVGVGSAVPAFPQSSLEFGQLDLSAADVRLSPSRMPPTIYAEAKTVYGALRLNRGYGAAASTRGRFTPLRNNRIHEDPILGDRRFDAALATAAGTVSMAFVTRTDGLMLIYHLFYGVDDGARRRPGARAANREFHHLALGLFFDDAAAAAQGAAPSLIGVCRGPDRVKVMPFTHAALDRYNAVGEPDVAGEHTRATTEAVGERRRAMIELKRQALEASQEASELRQSAADDQAQANAAAAGSGALAGTALLAGSPAAAALLLVLAALLTLLGHLAGADKAKRAAQLDKEAGGKELLAEAEKERADEDRKADLSVGAAEGGPMKVVLKPIPHGLDKNLYGLRADGPDTLTIDDDPALRELLAWWAFPGGVGYQFDCQGARDEAGSSFRSYFDLFLRKVVELREAQALVSYFGA